MGSEDVEIVEDFLYSHMHDFFEGEDYKFYPELIVGSPNNIARTSYVKDETTFPTIFHFINNYKCMYQIIKTPNLSFAVCFSYLMVAIDFIRLGQMPWAEILNNGTGHV